MIANRTSDGVQWDRWMVGRRAYLNGIDHDTLNLELPDFGSRAFDLAHGHPGECLICCERKLITKRQCCDFSVCRDCLCTYYSCLVSRAVVQIQCIGGSCKEYVTQDELISHLDEPLRQRFRQLLVDANRDPNRKTCPRCNHITDLDQKAQPHGANKKFGVQVTCTKCQLVWCFTCQSPWHELQSCKDYQRGDLFFKTWTKGREIGGQANAQKCPKCKAYIQRISGCDHMTCSRCTTNFCYRCGEKYRNLKFIGNHHSRLSIFGCKYRFNPHSPVKRRLIRGAIFGGKLLAAPVVGGLALGAGVVVLGIGLVALPFYGGYQLHRLVKRKRKEKKNALHFNCYLDFIDTMEPVADTHEFSDPPSLFGLASRDENSIDPDKVPALVLTDYELDSDVEIEGFTWELSSGEETDDQELCDFEVSDISLNEAGLPCKPSKPKASSSQAILCCDTSGIGEVSVLNKAFSVEDLNLEELDKLAGFELSAESFCQPESEAGDLNENAAEISAQHIVVPVHRRSTSVLMQPFRRAPKDSTSSSSSVVVESLKHHRSCPDTVCESEFTSPCSMVTHL